MKFIGRQFERESLEAEYAKERASLGIVYGRRRIGKTRLLAEFCQKKSFFRFEGLEKGSLEEQIRHFLKQLSGQAQNPLLEKLACSSWNEALDALTQVLPKEKKHILVFDEFPWMIQEDEKAVALFKFFWDNVWNSKKGLMIIFCGSVNTFMVKKVLFSSALYGRFHFEIKLDPLTPQEVKAFLPKRDLKEVVDTYMVFGGIPKYLEEMDPNASTIQNINRLCFTKNALFVREFDRLFRDEFKTINTYTKIVEVLAKRPHLNYSEIVKALGTDVGGGYQSYLENLKIAGFVEAYTPLNRSKTQLIRYRLVDEFTLFYFHLMRPHLKQIEENKGENIFLNFVGKNRWMIWTGFAFERFCLKQSKTIQKILRIDQLVKNSGSYFNRRTSCENGLQIDLVFDRHDPVITLCEIKYTTRPVGTEVIDDLEKKAASIQKESRKTIEHVLITSAPPAPALLKQNYFHKIIVLEDFFREGLI